MRRKSKEDSQDKKRKTSFPLLLRKSDSASSVRSSSNDSTSGEIEQREKRRSIFEDEAPVDFFQQEVLNTVSLSDDEDNVTVWKSSVGKESATKSPLTDQLKNRISGRNSGDNYGTQTQTVIPSKSRLSEVAHVPNKQIKTDRHMKPESTLETEIIQDGSSYTDSEDSSDVKLARCPGLLESLKEDLESLINVFDKDDRSPDWNSPNVLRRSCVDVDENNSVDRKGNLIVRCYSNPDSMKARDLESESSLDKKCLERSVSEAVTEHEQVSYAANDNHSAQRIHQFITGGSLLSKELEPPTLSSRSNQIGSFQSDCSDTDRERNNEIMPGDGFIQTGNSMAQEVSDVCVSSSSDFECPPPVMNRDSDPSSDTRDTLIKASESLIEYNSSSKQIPGTTMTNRSLSNRTPEIVTQRNSLSKKGRNKNVALNSDISDISEFNRQLSSTDSDVFLDNPTPLDNTCVTSMTMSLGHNDLMTKSEMKITKSQSFTVESQRVDKNNIYRTQSVVVLQEGKFHTYIKKRNSVSEFDPFSGSCSLKNFRDSSILDLKRRESLQEKLDTWVLQLHPINKTEVFV